MFNVLLSTVYFSFHVPSHLYSPHTHTCTHHTCSSSVLLCSVLFTSCLLVECFDVYHPCLFVLYSWSSLCITCTTVPVLRVTLLLLHVHLPTHTMPHVCSVLHVLTMQHIYPAYMYMHCTYMYIHLLSVVVT